MYEISTAIEIVATPERLTTFVQPTNGKVMIFRPTVLVAQPNQALKELSETV